VPEPDCAPDAGRVVPRIDRNRCEAKADCVRVCPYDVFEIRALSQSVLSLFQRVVELSANLSDELSTLAGNIQEPSRLADFVAGSYALSAVADFDKTVTVTQ